MRRIITLLTATVLAFSGLAHSPAYGTGVEYDCSDGTTTISGPTYTLTGGMLTSGDDCIGTVIIAAGVETVADSAFQDANITEIQISNTVTTISDSAFSGTNLTSISIPDSVIAIDGSAFTNTRMLTSFTVDPGNLNYSSDGGVLFNKLKTTLVSYPAAKGTDYVIPSSVTTVGSYSFYNLGPENALESVVIPASVTAIEGLAFVSPENVDFFFLGTSNPVAGSSAFGLVPTGTAYISSIAATGSFPLTGGKWEGISVQTGSLVTYDSNGATGGSTPVNNQPLHIPGSLVTVFSNSGSLTKTNYLFDGWNTAANGSGSSYLASGSESLTSSGDVTLYAKWVIDPAYVAAVDLAARTISAKKKYVVKPLAKKVGVTIVSSKAKVTFKIAKSSSRICTKSGSKLKTLKAGNCVVTFTVQEPKPKKGKKPKATKSIKTLVVQ
jgi:uncharacterized repeat protein (TIGR02543 family)